MIFFLDKGVAGTSSFVSESMKDNSALRFLLLIYLPQSVRLETLNFDRDIDSCNNLLQSSKESITENYLTSNLLF